MTYQTSDNAEYARVPVDQGQTGFFEGREFRCIRKIEVTAGTSLVWKFTSPVDFILIEQQLNTSVGDIEFYAWPESLVTETGTYGDDEYVRGKNLGSTRRLYDGAPYVSQVEIKSGGGITISNSDLYADYDRAKTSGATAQQVSVGGAPNSERYLPAGTYYLEFRSLDATSLGRYSLAWEERPEGV